MKIIIFLLTILLLSSFLFSIQPKKVNAQMMMPMIGSVSQEIYNHTVQEETEGQIIYSNLISGQINTNQLTNDELGKIGEYFMGRMVGDTQRHAQMNQMMSNMMGESTEEAIHINIGRRYVNSYSQTGVLNNSGSSMMMSGCR